MPPSRKQEKALLMGLQKPKIKREAALLSLEELTSLAHTSGLAVMQTIFAELRQITPATFMGEGKAKEIADLVVTNKYDVVVVDAELAPYQNRNLTELWKVKVVDRTQIILDIFALHAKSREGKLQVELAQYEYLYPRLVGAWTHLSKQRGGGVGLRGPGETQLEVDRRRVRERIHQLRKELKTVTSSRKLHRQKREAVPMPVVTLIGYTNAGKSTLFNALTESSVLAVDQLFATLDPKTTKIRLPSGREVLLSDTVGFIRNLPHELVEAFHSTFEEVRYSDLLLHVIDVSSADWERQKEVVETVLRDLELDEMHLINIFNKMDQLSDPPLGLDGIAISAQKKQGMDHLLQTLDEELSRKMTRSRIFLTHDQGNILSQYYRVGRVFSVKNEAKGTWVDVALPKKFIMQNMSRKSC